LQKKNVESKIFDGALTSRDNKDEEKSDFEIFKENLAVKTAYDDMELIERCQDALRVILNQTPDRSSNNIESWFTHESNLNTITIGAKTIMNCSLIKILAVLSEVDLISKFVSRIESITKLKEYSFCRWMVRICLNMPVTFTNREIIAMGFGYLDPKDNTILMPFRSVNDEYYKFLQPPAEDPNYVRIEIIFGFFRIKYIDEQTIEVINCYNVDPKVPVIPWFLLNTFIREISYYIMEDFKNQIENVDFSIYEERINKNRVFYDHLINSIKKNGLKTD